MKARDLMTCPVISIRPHLPVREAAARLVTHGFTAAPVVTAEGSVVGMVTEADLLRGQMAAAEDTTDPAAVLPVSAVMTTSPIAVHPEDDLTEVVALMLDRGIRAVPVIDRGHHLLGIITRRDILRGAPTESIDSAGSAAM